MTARRRVCLEYDPTHSGCQLQLVTEEDICELKATKVPSAYVITAVTFFFPKLKLVKVVEVRIVAPQCK